MTTQPIFRFGDNWICMERGSGYAPGLPDHVTFAVRQVKPERLRTRMPVLHAAQAVLEHCDGTAAGLHVLIAAADLNGGLPVNRIAGFDAREYPINHEAIAH